MAGYGSFGLRNPAPPPVATKPHRGGPQYIPRPTGARAGGPAPWAGMPASELNPTLGDVVGCVSRHEPGHWGSLVPTDAPSAPAAVLVLLYEDHDRTHVVLTRRASHMRHHGGEIAFPGGRREPGDSDLWATALREAREEVNLDGASIRPVGRLDSFTTVTSGSWACPYVATSNGRPRLAPNPAEVESVLHVTLGDLLHPDAWREEIWPLGEHPERAMPFFDLPGHTIWGATARVLRQLLELVTSPRDPARPSDSTG